MARDRLNPLLVAGKYSTMFRFTPGEINIAGLGLNPLLVAGKYSTDGKSFYFVESDTSGQRCLNPLLVAGKYSTLLLYIINLATNQKGVCVSIPF